MLVRRWRWLPDLSARCGPSRCDAAKTYLRHEAEPSRAVLHCPGLVIASWREVAATQEGADR